MHSHYCRKLAAGVNGWAVSHDHQYEVALLLIIKTRPCFKHEIGFAYKDQLLVHHWVQATKNKIYSGSDI